MSAELALPDDLQVTIDGLVAGRIFVPLREYGRWLDLDHKAVSKRNQRGTLGVRTIRTSKTAPLLVPVVDIYRVLGLTPPHPGATPRLATAQVEFHDDGSIRVIETTR